MLGSLTLYLKGMRIMMFQLSSFYCICPEQAVEQCRSGIPVSHRTYLKSGDLLSSYFIEL